MGYLGGVEEVFKDVGRGLQIFGGVMGYLRALVGYLEDEYVVLEGRYGEFEWGYGVFGAIWGVLGCNADNGHWGAPTQSCYTNKEH